MQRSRPRRLRILDVLLGLGLIAIATSAWLLLRDPGEAGAAANTTTVTRGTVETTVSASGSVESRSSLEAAFVGSGRVTEVLVREGERVRKREIVARMHLVGGGTARLKAPMRGTVTAVHLAVGQTVGTYGDTSVSIPSDSSGTTSSASVEVTDLRRLVVNASFSEADVAELKVMQRATVTFDALGMSVKATVTRIDATPTTDESGVVRYGVTLRPATLPGVVRSGATATIEVVTDRARDTISVPSATIQDLGGRQTVTVVRNGRQQQVVVTTGIEGDQTTEIVSGLSEGDTVVIPTTGGTSGFPGGGFPGGGAVQLAGGGPPGAP